MLKLYYMNIKPLLEDENQLNSIIDKLSPIRREKVERFTFAEGKARSAAAGLCLREALTAEGIDYINCEFKEGQHGKPYIKGRPLHFSLSHVEDVSVCLVSDKQIGIDIECLDMRQKKYDALSKIARRFFCEEELSYLFADDDQSEEIFRSCFANIWTKKEAYGKFTGNGIGYEMMNVNTLADPGFYTMFLGGMIMTIYGKKIDPKELVIQEVSLCTMN